jgi:hypothetical protein
MSQLGYFSIDLDTKQFCKEFLQLYNPEGEIFTHEFGVGYESFQTTQWALDDVDPWRWYKKQKTSYQIREFNELNAQVGELCDYWIRKWFKFLPRHICLNLVKQNVPVERHIDHPARSTVIVINPCKENFYGTTQHFNDGDRQLPYFPVCVLNTQIPHSTPPLDRQRPSIHLPYSMPIEEMLEIYTAGELLN